MVFDGVNGWYLTGSGGDWVVSIGDWVGGSGGDEVASVGAREVISGI